jgi:hypothetical protein
MDVQLGTQAVYDGAMFFDTGKRFLGRRVQTGQDDQWQQLRTELQDEDTTTASISFTVSGTEYRWGPGPDVGAVIYIVDWDDADPTTDSRFVQWGDGKLVPFFRSAFWGTDSQGNILGGIASQEPLSELPDKWIRTMVLFHTISIVGFKDMTNGGYSSLLGFYATVAGKDSPPYIIINR